MGVSNVVFGEGVAGAPVHEVPRRLRQHPQEMPLAELIEFPGRRNHFGAPLRESASRRGAGIPRSCDSSQGRGVAGEPVSRRFDRREQPREVPRLVVARDDQGFR
jgi:hypothetical protein